MAANQQNDEYNESNEEYDSSIRGGRTALGTIFRTKGLTLIIIAVIVSLIFFPAINYFLDMDDTREDASDPKNTPAAVKKFASDTEIDEDGNIRLKTTVLELWEKMQKEDNTAIRYLNSPEELSKLINASIALDYPDTRKDPSKKIKLEDIKLTSVNVQGIVKFKRATQDGKIDYMTYVSPEKFQEYISKYEKSHSKADRKEALKHFTMEKVASNSASYNGAKVSSLNGMVFMGDSILTRFDTYKRDELKQEGAVLLFKSGCTAHYFLGTEVVDTNSSGCKETADGHFDWNANFQNITNPTGFYLMLGQNYYWDGDHGVGQTEELIKKIRSYYPNAPIFISSVLHPANRHVELAAQMNEAFKKYCEDNVNLNVHFSDILRNYEDNIPALTEDDNDHPNKEGVEILLKNIKENIIGTSSTVSTATTSTYTAPTTTPSVSGSRSYNNDTLDVDKMIDTQKKMKNPHNNSTKEFRASQSACYDGKYIIHFQNKNYGNDYRTSNNGGRMAWTNLETGEIDYIVETKEGGHGDGVAYDSERNVVLKCVDGDNNLLEFDNNTKTIVRTYKNARI